MRGSAFTLMFLCLLGLSGVVNAGPVQMPQTGQQTCWNTVGLEIACPNSGQDGELKKGEPWPVPRFADQGQAITDNLTNLIWTKDANTPGPAAACEAGLAKTWQGALDHVKCLNSNNYLGYNDWRLPNVNELESLINYEVNYAGDSDSVLSVSEWLELMGQGFANVRPYSYWSSSSEADAPGFAWVINMYAGYLQSAPKLDMGGYVWPVRTAQTPDLALLGMTVQTAGPFKRVITLEVINSGTARATGVSVDFYRDGAEGILLHRETIASLDVQEVRSVVYEWDVMGIPVSEEGLLTAYGVINREQTVPEKTHLNNSAALKLAGAFPAIVASPSIPDGAAAIATRPIFNWGAASGASVYDLYLWKEGEARPAAPAFAGLSAGAVKARTELAVSSIYHWQVVAKNISGQTEGPVWSFATRASILGDINGDGQVNLADAVLSLSAQIRVVMSKDAIRSDYSTSGVDVTGNGKIGLGETIYILQEVTEIR